MSRRARRHVWSIVPVLAILGLVGLANPTSAAQIQRDASLQYLTFSGDGGCPSDPALSCGQSWDLELGIGLPTFDATLGTLQSIDFTSTAVSFSAMAQYDIVTYSDDVAPSFGGREATQCLGLPVGSTCDVDYGVFSETLSGTIVGEGDLKFFYIGDGVSMVGYSDFVATVEHSYGFQANAGLQLEFVGDTPQFTVTYNYTPVPEPSTAPLLAAGLVGIGAVRRKHRRP